MNAEFFSDQHGYVDRKKGKSNTFLVLLPIFGLLAFAGVAAVVLGLIPVYLSSKIMFIILTFKKKL